MKKTVCELFAGVGGFRLGLDRLSSGWETVWFSQWEPGKKKQWAYECYVSHFGTSADLTGNTETSGNDIAQMDKENIPDHTLLVGGFPCQDYSVAHTLKSSKGIEGKKGVLWWQIRDTLQAKNPPFCLFENVDRLLKSPASQRGRDFGIMLFCLNELGYSVEWRIVNAALYGAAQRRRRVFIFAYKNDETVYGRKMKDETPENIMLKSGFMVKAFPIASNKEIHTGKLFEDIGKVSDDFQFPFLNAGFMRNGEFSTVAITEQEEPPILLRDILEENVAEEFYISEENMPKWEYMKGGKRLPRTAANGHQYIFSEGPVAFPDPSDRPGRTMLTSESTMNRSTHVVEDPATHRLRILTPVEAERLQGFDDNWTDTMPQRFRYFCMGNALVVPMITRMGKVLDKIIKKED